MREIAIVVHVHTLYQTLLSCIQSIFVLLILRYVEKLFESNENRNSNRVRRNLNDERRLIVQSLCDDLSYHRKKLRIQLLIDWRTRSNERERDDDIMLSNLVLKLAHCAKNLDWVFDHTLSELFDSSLIVDRRMMRLLHLSEKITKRDFNVWKRCRKCRSFKMSETELN